MQHQDKRTRCRFGQTKPVQHFTCIEPAVVLNRFLRHIGENGIGAAERNDRHLRKEHCLLRKHMAAAQKEYQRSHRPKPQGAADDHCSDGSKRHAGPCRRFAGRAIHAHIPFGRSRGNQSASNSDETENGGARDHQREGNIEKENRNEGRSRHGIKHALFHGALRDTDQCLDHNSEDCRLDAEEQRLDKGKIGIGGIKHGKRHHHRDARQNEHEPRRKPALHTMEQPAGISRELLRFRARQ